MNFQIASGKRPLSEDPGLNGGGHSVPIRIKFYCVAIARNDDGDVVVPHEIAQEVIEKAHAIVRKEEAIKARLDQGETTMEIFGIDPIVQP